MSLPINKIYALHHKPLRQRKERLLNIFEQKKLTVEWVENEEVEEDFYHYSPEKWTQKLNDAYPNDPTPPRPLRKSEISIGVKHYECFKRLVDSPHQEAIVFEDDVLFFEDFKEKFLEYFERTPPYWDAIFFGYGSFLRVENYVGGQLVYPRDHPVTRCLDSYIIKKEACKKILQDLKPISLPIDFELSYSFLKHDLKAYWWDPPLTAQGSQNNFYPSAIQ